MLGWARRRKVEAVLAQRFAHQRVMEDIASVPAGFHGDQGPQPALAGDLSVAFIG
jgi:hypothetical protein